MIEHVADIDDPRVAVYRDIKDRELAAEGERFMAEGSLVVERLLRSRYPVESVMCAERKLEGMRGWFREGVPVYVVPDAVVHRLVGYKFHTGLLAVGRRPARGRLEEVVPRGEGVTVVVLPQMNDLENIGSIVRTAAGFGVDAVVLGEACADPFYRRAVRVSMGTMFTMPLYRSADIRGDLGRLRDEWEMELVATVIDAGAEELAGAKRGGSVGLLFGSEFTGLAREHVELCQRRVRIPMALGTDSLNVSMAAAVFLYHYVQVTGGARGEGDGGQTR